MGEYINQLLSLDPADRSFLDSVIKVCDNLGADAVVLQVGSRAAGFAGPDADLDLWIVGDKDRLSDEQRSIHDRDGSVFVDRGDSDAHWTFFDREILTGLLSEWQDEKVWIVSTSKYLHGNRDTFEVLKDRYGKYPLGIAGTKLKWLVGHCGTLLGSMWGSDEEAQVTRLIASGRLIEGLYKICCVADRIPIPYTKWLVKVGDATRLGGMIGPDLIQISVAGSPSTPIRQSLVEVRDAALELLPSLGWDTDWIRDPFLAISESLKRPSP